MRASVLLSLILAFGALLVFPTMGCGGGGTAPAATATVLDAFVGNYASQFFTGDSSSAHLEAAGWSIFESDGAGMVTRGTARENRGGTILGPAAITPHPYALLADGRLRFTQSYTYPSTYEGGLTADGSTAILATVGDGDRPGVSVLGRRRDDFTAVALQGSYHMAALFLGGASHVSWFAGTAILDAAGIVEVRTARNTDGVITSPPATPARVGTWFVGDGEALVWTADSGEVFEGGILLDGELIVLTGSTTAGALQAMIVLIRKGPGVTAATFSGNYHTVLLGSNGGPPVAHAGHTFKGVADGAGGWTYGDGALNVDGTITRSSASVSLTYGTLPTGEFSFGSMLIGGISPTGRAAVVAGGTSAGDAQIMQLFLRVD